MKVNIIVADGVVVSLRLRTDERACTQTSDRPRISRPEAIGNWTTTTGKEGNDTEPVVERERLYPSRTLEGESTTRVYVGRDVLLTRAGDRNDDIGQAVRSKSLGGRCRGTLKWRVHSQFLMTWRVLIFMMRIIVKATRMIPVTTKINRSMSGLSEMCHIPAKEGRTHGS